MYFYAHINIKKIDLEIVREGLLNDEFPSLEGHREQLLTVLVELLDCAGVFILFFTRRSWTRRRTWWHTRL